MTLVAKDIRKHYGGIAALRGADLEIRGGEIHALLGPNGSGKSTFIRCLSGATAPDSGTITIGSERVTTFTPRAALAAGTAVIYQHFSLVPALSVADNVFLGSELRSAGRIDRRRQWEESGRLISLLGHPINPKATVASLSVGERQIVEIAKALRHKPSLLILDEPTAALGEAEARALGRLLRGLRGQGLAILYVTHFVNEVFEIADRVTVLRDGAVAVSGDVTSFTKRDIIAAIAPETGARALGGGKRSKPGSESLLELTEFGDTKIGPIDLSVGKGEIVGVFGLLGSGRTELLEGIFGIRPAVRGQRSLGGKSFRPRTPRDSIDCGVVLVAADRTRQSMLGRMSALENMMLPHFSKLARTVTRNRPRELTEFSETARKVGLKPPTPVLPARAFSGGNQQKIAIGRWLTPSSSVRLLMLDEPTQGIDIGARNDLYVLLSRLAKESGIGVLFTSSDPDEVEALGDRAVVLNRGRIVGELRGSEIKQTALLDLAHSQARNGA
jgi:ribose transport system ATP-binding protein